MKHLFNIHGEVPCIICTDVIKNKSLSLKEQQVMCEICLEWLNTPVGPKKLKKKKNKLPFKTTRFQFKKQIMKAIKKFFKRKGKLYE